MPKLIPLSCLPFFFIAVIVIDININCVQCLVANPSNHTSRNTFSSSEKNLYNNVIVIGAGVAGLSAAQALKNAGEASVIVLEANDYIGGRVKTIEVGGVKIDAGATWIEGVKGNPIKKLATNLGVTCVGSNRYWKKDMGYDEKTNTRFKYKKVAKYEKKFTNWINWLRKRLGSNASGKDAAVLFYKEYPLKGKNKSIGQYAVEEVLMGMDYGADSADVSLKHFWEDEGYPGGDCVFPDTYGQIIDGLADDLDIYLSTPVDSIEYSNGIVKVQSNGRIFTANKVIVTVSLGVLQANSISFEPDLPRRKRNAINRLRMGRLEKAILVFKSNFWKKHGLYFVSSYRSESMRYYDFSKFYGAPTLVAEIPADYPLMASFGDTDVVQLCLKQLKIMLKLETIPQPEDYFVSRWQDDPYFRGSYSYLPVGSSPNDMKILAEAVNNKVFFAGEATDHLYSSYTHAALRSGIRVAKEIKWKANLDNFLE